MAKPLFIHESQHLSAEQFKDLIQSDSKVSLTSEEEMALKYFDAYITQRETATKGWYIHVCMHDRYQ